MRIAIITGASSGIGREFALQLDRRLKSVDEFWLIARRKDALSELSAALQHRTRLFSMDITKENEMEDFSHALQNMDAKVKVLVNCAGYGIYGMFAEQEREEQLGMIRLNCEALTNMTHRVIPFMTKGSRIIQLSSSAAFAPQQKFAVYAATKSFVLSFSKALRFELREKGISVTAVCPGPVDTPFFDRAEKKGDTLAIKEMTMVSAKEVVSLAILDAANRKSISICSPPIKCFSVVAKLVPHDLILTVLDLLYKMRK